MEKNLKIPDNLLKPPKIGDIVEGKIIAIGKSSVFLDLGTFGTGIIYGKEFIEGKESLKKLKVGNNLFAKIIDLENEQGYIELSISQAGKELAWQNLTQKKERDETLKIKILGANKGGLLTEISGISAFLPVSQLSSEHYPLVENGDQAKILKELKKFIGQELEVKIFDISPKERKLILSEKAKETEKIKKILKKYKVGDVVEGEVTAILDFGVFIKFSLPSEAQRVKEGVVITKDEPAFAASSAEVASATEAEKASAGENFVLEGLIHISELDWKLIEDPLEIVKIGEKIKAKIIKISGDKVSLSSKALKENPWQDFAKKYKIGEKISGQVIKFTPFGAFVRVNEKIQGLCHVSAFGSQEKMKDILEIGKKYDFEILEIQPVEYRLNLKFKK